LPFLPAYKNLIEGQDITKGVNFAFAGATALDFNYFNKSMVALPGTNNSLSVQLKMFKRLKPSLCKNKKGIVTSSFAYTFNVIFKIFFLIKELTIFVIFMIQIVVTTLRNHYF
jgi:hypothetical protein